MRIKSKEVVREGYVTKFKFTLICANCGEVIVTEPLPERAALDLLTRKCAKCEAVPKSVLGEVSATATPKDTSRPKARPLKSVRLPKFKKKGKR
jgi:hypothetical protein